MKYEQNTIRRMRHDDSAVGHMGSLFQVIGIFFIGMMIIAFSTDPVKLGIDKGELPPTIQGDAHHYVPGSGGGNWEKNWNLHDHFNMSWDAEEADSDKWFVIEFLDTDCPYCWTAGDSQSQISEYWGDKITQIGVVVALNIDGHSGSRAEIEAFQGKLDFEGCKTTSNCKDRPGEPHNFIYIDDLDASSMGDWNLRGTPSCFILQPNGLVYFGPGQGTCDDIPAALNELFPIGQGA